MTAPVTQSRKSYAHDLIVDEALQWIDKQKNNPFFLYLALNVLRQQRGRTWSG